VNEAAKGAPSSSISSGSKRSGEKKGTSNIDNLGYAWRNGLRTKVDVWLEISIDLLMASDRHLPDCGSHKNEEGVQECYYIMQPCTHCPVLSL
jgi:hypothetical protein